MSKALIRSAWGCAPELPLLVNTLTDLDSVDSNRVHVVARTSPVTITSFGPGTLVKKRVRFDAGITIQPNPPNLILLTTAARVTVAGDVGIYYADQNGVWREEKWHPGPFKQVFTAYGKITCPLGYTTAFIQIVSQGYPVGGFGIGANPHFGANGAYAQKMVVAVGGQFCSYHVGGQTGYTDSQILRSAGNVPPPGSYAPPDTWPVGNIQCVPDASGGTATGGDINLPGAVGTYDAVHNIASMPAGQMCPAQSISSGHATGALYGGGAIAVDGQGANGGQGALWITWME